MAPVQCNNIQLKAILSLLILALAVTCATSARILDEEVVAPTLPPEGTDTVDPPVPNVTPGGTAAPAAVASSGVGAESPDHMLTFFMHDILGGSTPSAIAVTGVVTNPAVGGQVPFAKPNGAVLPVNNGIPVNNANSGIINNNNIPFLTGLSGTAPNLVQQNGNSIIGGGFGFPALNPAQFPTGTTFQSLMFGTMTVFDDELTEGHELGSGLVGKAQGFYIASSEDGTSQTMAFTVMFASGSYADSLSFFGVHRTAVSESHLAIMGGTGKYVNAKGLATVKTFPANLNQHSTDGVETVLEITVYLAY
ncbi:dirigent protein 25-like [Coffea arabica]|uniref:Dirigent protein n=1 Tax=Coffea arabica TaxID=13443 RepID=A0A6P6W0H9_COFAR|nr:dirigent protein 25-like [Coffea arabica]